MHELFKVILVTFCLGGIGGLFYNILVDVDSSTSAEWVKALAGLALTAILVALGFSMYAMAMSP